MKALDESIEVDQQALGIVRNVLAEIGWTPDANDSGNSLFVDLQTTDSPVAYAHIAIAPDTHRFLFYLNFGVAVPEEQRDECARLITRINWGLAIGNFEMDYADGQIRFKNSLDFGGEQLNKQLVRNCILGAMMAAERYAGAIHDVSEARCDALSALAIVAGKTSQP